MNQRKGVIRRIRGISGSLKFHGFVSGRENENNCEDEQEFAGVITCA